MEMTLQIVRVGSDNLETWIGCKRMVTQASRVVWWKAILIREEMLGSLGMSSQGWMVVVTDQEAVVFCPQHWCCVMLGCWALKFGHLCNYGDMYCTHWVFPMFHYVSTLYLGIPCTWYHNIIGLSTAIIFTCYYYKSVEGCLLTAWCQQQNC
jgi:hypothetical protein